MKSSIQILLSEPLVVEIGAQRVEIRELTWLQLLSFTQKLASVASEFISVSDGTIRVSVSDLAKFVRSSEELSVELITCATSLDSTALAALPARAVIVILDQALALNFSEEFLAAGKALAARLQGVVPGLAQAKSAASSSI